DYHCLIWHDNVGLF
nr:immunoglobulin light chain junction region [Macaca mulatta]MOX70653.1 immunoglobulin light chain junction region [Macaca mulatta]MOX70665.1 immunoglobulin light chain junction region [Macaca mulatta]MOX71026.1 immunoglobulin light chain junction region [Macaca mulatta]MOX71468.1 immunoglobulin light chain junction region [Macaca mulatta]